jgi:hypothetical protein
VTKVVTTDTRHSRRIPIKEIFPEGTPRYHGQYDSPNMIFTAGDLVGPSNRRDMTAFIPAMEVRE